MCLLNFPGLFWALSEQNVEQPCKPCRVQEERSKAKMLTCFKGRALSFQNCVKRLTGSCRTVFMIVSCVFIFMFLSAYDRTATIDGPNLEHHQLGSNLLCSTFCFQTRCKSHNMCANKRAFTESSFIRNLCHSDP